MQPQIGGLPVWQHMATVGLQEMACVRLMNRVDTKYAARADALPRLLEAAARQGYRVQIADAGPVAPYDTLYFDTPACDMYLLHHNGVLHRQKIRTRTYLNSGTTFLEVKNKDNRGRTEKLRIRLPRERFDDFSANDEATGFLAGSARFAPGMLIPQVNTRFKRITLVDDALSERVTIDFDLTFRNRTTGLEAALANLTVIELKQNGALRSTMRRLLCDEGIRPFKISKYCIGTVLTNPHVKSNRFKAKLRSIEKLTHSTNFHD